MELEKDPTNKGLNRLSPALQQEIKTRADSSPLPLWPAQTRGIPNICLRSSLFGVIQRGRRKAVKGEVIAAVKGLDIRYTVTAEIKRTHLLDQGEPTPTLLIFDYTSAFSPIT